MESDKKNWEKKELIESIKVKPGGIFTVTNSSRIVVEIRFTCAS